VDLWTTQARCPQAPEDAKEAYGHGIRAKRSKSGAVSFEVLDVEAENAPVE
jgi:hypothetical protein